MGRSNGEHPRRSRPSRQVTIRELARAVGVSETTVSLAFQPHSRIAAATRDKVMAMSRKMGYIPNLAARALRLGSPKSIGFLVNDIANPFYAFLVRNADVIARQRGYQIVVADSQWDPERETEVVENLISSRVRGVVACSSEKSPRTFQALAECKVPCIVVDTVPEDYRGGFVANDLAAAGRLAAEHLREVRCRRLALLTAGPQMDSFSAMVQLRKGFLEAAGQCGMDVKRVCIVPAGLTIDGGKLGFQRLMKRAPDCDGVLCANDLCALGAIEAADALGIRVGPGVAIMGIDDLDISSTARISLTSIRQPSRRMIDLAVTALIDGIENHECPDVTMLLRPELIVRNSTRRMSAALQKDEP
jgi:LacI family transcriptional regulator